VGDTLLERSNRNVKLAVDGQRFLRDARHVLAYTEQAETAARRLARGEIEQLLLGFTALSGYHLILGLLWHAGLQLPDVGFELHEIGF
jgi:DNA-binding transcriptional LysR family regulator